MDFNKSLKQILDTHLTDNFVKTYKNQPSLWNWEPETTNQKKKKAYEKLEKILLKQGIEPYKDYVAKKIRLLNAFYDRRKEQNKLIESRSINSFKNKSRLLNHILLNFNVEENQTIKDETTKQKQPQTFSKFLMTMKRQEMFMNTSLSNNESDGENSLKENKSSTEVDILSKKNIVYLCNTLISNNLAGGEKDLKKKKINTNVDLSLKPNIVCSCNSSVSNNIDDRENVLKKKKSNTDVDLAPKKNIFGLSKKKTESDLNSSLNNATNEPATIISYEHRKRENRCYDDNEALARRFAAQLSYIENRSFRQKLLSEKLINNILQAAMLGKLTSDSIVLF